MKEIKLIILGSAFREPKSDVRRSLNLVARNSPAIIPANEKILRNKPDFNPSSAGINTNIKIIMSRVSNI